MCTITVTEFKKNFGKYNQLAQKEEVQVSHRGQVIYRLVPQKYALLKEWEHFFGILPADANFDDVERE